MPARVRTPTDKPRVEGTVPFVRASFLAGERFIDLADAQRRAQTLCTAMHRDNQIEVARALYSIPGNLIGQ